MCYYNLANKKAGDTYQANTGTNQKKKGKPIITQSAKWYKIMRFEELEKELEKVCGKYENDCSKCPKQAECEEYCKLSQEEED